METNTVALIKGPPGGSTFSLKQVDWETLENLRDAARDHFLLINPPAEPGPMEIARWERWSGPLMVRLNGPAEASLPDYSRIVVATANPGRIRALAEWVAELAAAAHGHVYLLVTLEQADDADDADLQAEYHLAQEQLSTIATSLRLLGIHAHWEVRFGELGEEVATLARTTGSKVIALDRPGEDEPGCDVARVYKYLREHGPKLYLLIKPADEVRPRGNER